jgi:lipopolysaccharide transport protein LptA
MMVLRGGLTLLVLFFGAVLPATVLSEDVSNTALKTADLGDMIVESQSFEWRIKEKAVVFTREVTARREDLTIGCDKITFYYSESQNGDVDYDRILATGNVRIAFYGNEDHTIPEGPARAIREDEALFIDSESFEMDNNERLFVFSGDVELRREDITMNCEKMIGYYSEKSTEEGPENSESVIGNIDRIIATEGVRMARADGLSGTAEKAVYDFAEEKVVMTGEPVFKQGKNSWRGSSLTYHLREEVITGTDGKAVLHQKNEEGVLAGGQ